MSAHNEKAGCAAGGDGSLAAEAGKMHPEKADGGRIGGYVMTWLLSVASACIVGGAWVYTHPTPSFVAVDVNALVKAETELLAQAVKPDATKEQQEAAIRRASEFGKKLDDAIAQLAAECGCVVINTAAIVAQPASTPVRDATQRVKALVSQQ